MKILLLPLTTVVFAATASARDWIDKKGLVIEANVVGLTQSNVHLRLAGGKVIVVERSKLSVNDQDHLARFDVHRRTANRMRIVVRQAVEGGALGQVFLVKTITGSRDVVVGSSSFDGRPVTTNKVVSEDQVTLVSDNAYVEGLGTAADGDVIDFIAWTAGSYIYTAVSGAEKSVPKFSLNPPAMAKSASVEEFGR
jgi:SLA1 homology domain 1, SHD1